MLTRRLVSSHFGCVCPGGYSRRCRCILDRTVLLDASSTMSPSCSQGCCGIDLETFRWQIVGAIGHTDCQMNCNSVLIVPDNLRQVASRYSFPALRCATGPPSFSSRVSIMAVPHADCSDEPRARRNDCPIIAGDVYCIQESIYSAVFDILRVSNVKDAQLFSRCREAARSLVVKNHATAKRRPCIVMEDVTANVADPMSISKRREICLAASWEGTRLADLPKLFQFFSIPIHRNRGISPDSPDHYHSLPEWDIENGFLLAWRFKTTRMLINRWPEKELGTPPTEPYVFGQKAWSKIVSDCEAKEREWLRMCKEDPTFADRQARECLVSLRAECKQRTVTLIST